MSKRVADNITFYYSTPNQLDLIMKMEEEILRQKVLLADFFDQRVIDSSKVEVYLKDSVLAERDNKLIAGINGYYTNDVIVVRIDDSKVDGVNGNRAGDRLKVF